LTALTVMLTVPVAVSPSTSWTWYWKLAAPVKFVVGVKVKLPSLLSATEPPTGTPTTVRVSGPSPRPA
jgi:hypothetical protein